MSCRFPRGLPIFVLLGVTPLVASERVSYIEFFGYKGYDIASIRSALPVHEGDKYSDGAEARMRRAVAGIIGKEPTDVSALCCDESGNQLLFIGLPGASNRAFAYSPAPTGKQRLPLEILDLYRRLGRAREEAVRKGGQAAGEDDSNGYALSKDPPLKSLQLALRPWAIKHEEELAQVLAFSSAAEDREAASEAMGYARQSHQQIVALVHAARDPDDAVRNNATRALGVLAASNPALSSEIAPDTFVNMLSSGVWTDRNKGAAVLVQLTASRSPELLAKIRSQALDALIEMALWRDRTHAYLARIILGRIAGIPEERLHELAWKGPVELIVKAVER